MSSRFNNSHIPQAILQPRNSIKHPLMIENVNYTAYLQRENR